jgi:hypothetical protein
VNTALVAVAGTVIELGTVTELLLLPSATLTPPLGAVPDSVTVQESANFPVMEVLAQVSPLSVGVTEVPVPVRLTMGVDAVLEIVSCPLTELAVVGLN